MSDDFKVGSRVMLNSGGPTMTVISFIYYDGNSQPREVTCVWMSGYGSISAGVFQIAMIQRDRRND